MSKRMIGLSVALVGIMWSVASCNAAAEWDRGLEPLRLAAYRADAAVVARWIEEHRSIDHTARFREAVLEVASYAAADGADAPSKSDASIVATIRAILDSRQDPNDEICQRTFTMAADHGLPSIVNHMIARGTDVNCTDAGGATALQRVAEHADTEMTERLLKAGADPNKSSLTGGWHKAPLLLALERRRQDDNPGRYDAVIALLRRHGAKD